MYRKQVRMNFKTAFTRYRQILKTVKNLTDRPPVDTKTAHFRQQISKTADFDNKTVTSEGVVAQWCNPLTLQPEQTDGVGSKPGRTPPLESHDKESRTRLGLLYFCDISTGR